MKPKCLTCRDEVRLGKRIEAMIQAGDFKCVECGNHYCHPHAVSHFTAGTMKRPLACESLEIANEQIAMLTKELDSIKRGGEPNSYETRMDAYGKKIDELKAALKTDLHGILLELKQWSSSVSLNWGEDTDLWECTAISGGNRFMETHASARIAALNLLKKINPRALWSEEDAEEAKLKL